MIINQSDYLKVFYDQTNDLFIQTWTKSPENIAVFKKEMFRFVDIQKQYRVSKALWLHKNFALTFDDNTKQWAEKNIVHPCFESGIKKFAFVVSKHVFSHLSIIESFDDLDIPSMPRHFKSKKEAMDWLIEDIHINDANQKPTVIYEGMDKEGHMLIKIKNPSNVTNVIRLFKKFKNTDSFYVKNFAKYQSLTVREKEILFKYANGDSTKNIASSLNISVYTVRTHWRNIKQKLDVDSFVNATKYLVFYES